MKLFAGFFLYLTSVCVLPAQELDVEVYELENGLKVYLNEDKSAANVFGAVWVKAGGKHDPPEATGIAHYLEHMLFKGTRDLGTQDYDRERPYLDSIKAYYDQLGTAQDADARLAIQKKINQQELLASEFAIPNEFDRLLKSIGSTGVNATTSNDRTNYYNFFPSHQINKWLDIYAHRFQDPVFRMFQSELETVYEEKNRATDDLQRRVSLEFYENIYGTHPYSTQTVLGSVAHLKNPSLSRMYQFFEDYYVANNMALILSGNFDSEQVKPHIQATFGKLRRGKVPEFPEYPVNTFQGRELKKVRMTPIKAGFMGYKLVPKTHPDRPALDVIGEMMSNYDQTGFIDEMTLNNEVIYSGGYQEFLQDDGSTFIFFVPKLFGKSLKRFETDIRTQFEAIADGRFTDEYLASIKNSLYRNHKLSLEKLEDRADLMGNAFILDQSWEEMMAYPEQVAALTREAIQKATAQYYGDDYFVMYSRTGFPKKEKLKKPPYQPITARTEASSKYSRHFQEIPENDFTPKFIDFEKDVAISEGYLFHTFNPLNDVFTFRLSIARGHADDKVFKPLADALAASGTSKYSPRELKDEFARLGGSYSITCDYNSFDIRVTGLDAHFPALLGLTQHLLEDFKPTGQTVDYLTNQRTTENKLNKNNPSTGGSILYRYGLFREGSYYLNRLSRKELKKLEPGLLKEKLQELLANGFNAVHYVGQVHPTEVEELILKDPFFKKNTTDAYRFKEAVAPGETTIFLVNDKKAIQSYVYYVVNGEPLNHQDYFKKEAFNAYYTNSLSGLLFQEVREFRSLAYATGGDYFDPVYEPQKSGRLVLFTGSQADKTVEAVEVVLGMISQMPAYENRLPAIREGLLWSSGAAKPNFRELSTQVEMYRLTGFQEDPNRTAYRNYPDLRFGDIQSFFNTNIKDKPVLITIYGDASRMDLDRLGQLGKVVPLKMDAILTE